MEKEWVLVTGASTGIGEELARMFAEHGCPLILVARHEARLRELAEEWTRRYGVPVQVLAKDLARPTAAEEIHAAVTDERKGVSILVNNAGFGGKGLFAGGDLSNYVDMVQVNVTSLMQLTHRFLQPMITRGRGRILNVASTAAFAPGPLMAIYYASKAFVVSFSYALAEEVNGTGVTVTTVCPGPTRTRFHDRAGTTRSERVYGRWMMDAREVAESSYRALMEGRRMVTPGFTNKLTVQLARCAPMRLAARVTRRVIEG